MKKALLTIVLLSQLGNLSFAAVDDRAQAQPLGPTVSDKAWLPPALAKDAMEIGIHQSEFELLWADSLSEADDIQPIAAEPKVANVSEPATLGLLGLGLAAIGLMRSRKR
jgi:hypothetical protein